LAIGSFILGVVFCAFSLLQPVALTIDGQTSTVPAYGMTSGALLKHIGLEVNPGDRLIPPGWFPLLFTRQVSLTSSAQVDVFNQGVLVSFRSTERLPANLLHQAGILLFPFDTLIADGKPAEPETRLSPASRHVLQYRPAIQLHYHDDSEDQEFYSSALTVGAALWELGIHPEPGDLLNPPFNTLITSPITITRKRGRELTINDGGINRSIRSSASTIAEALSDAGLSPQGLDYCIPAEGQPLPADGLIRLVRVHEEIQLIQSPVPNKIEYQADPNTELDHRTVIDPGSYGLTVKQIKIRYENGQETSRQTEAEWVAEVARPQIIGYGTKVVIRTAQVDGRTIEYWRSVTVYATSYSPCNSGVPECLGKTANGMTVEKGVVGVIRSWYNLMNGQYIYVPGYGSAIIADIGAGFAGKDWIDLGYSDSDYVPWHSTLTIYFLTPVPPNIPWILP